VLVVEEDGEGRTALIAYARDDWRVLGRIDGVSQVRFDAAHGRVLYTRFDGNGLWATDAALSKAAIVQLSDRLPSRWRYRMWSLSPEGRVAYLDSDARCRSRLSMFTVGPAGLEAEPVHCLAAGHRSATNGFSAAGPAWMVSVASEDGTDIGFMPLPVERNEQDSVAKWLLSLRKKVS